jgi:hypothetical protein
MEELPGGLLAVDSAFESTVLGRMAARGADDGSSQYYFRHHGYERQTSDEVEFLHREQKTGRLVLSLKMAMLLEKGMDDVIATDTAFNGVTPRLAETFRKALDRSRAQERAQIVEAEVQPVADDIVMTEEQPILLNDNRPDTEVAAA